MNNFTSAFDLMKDNLERKIADMDIKNKIDLSKLDSKQYQVLITSITRQFCKTGNYKALSSKKIDEYIRMVATSNVFDLTKNHRQLEKLSREAEKVRDDLLLAVSLSKTSSNSASFTQYKAILRKRYRRICAEIKSLEFGEKA